MACPIEFHAYPTSRHWPKVRALHHPKKAPMKRKALRINGLLAAAVAFGLLAPVQAVAGDEVARKVKICHATGSVTNPYRSESPNESSIASIDTNGTVTRVGHGLDTGPVFDPAINTSSASGPDGKVQWGDIIPVFAGFGGQNVTLGQAWLDNSCENPGTGTSGTGTSGTGTSGTGTSGTGTSGTGTSGTGTSGTITTKTGATGSAAPTRTNPIVAPVEQVDPASLAVAPVVGRALGSPTLAYTGVNGVVPLGIFGLIALVLGTVLTVAAHRPATNGQPPTTGSTELPPGRRGSAAAGSLRATRAPACRSAATRRRDRRIQAHFSAHRRMPPLVPRRSTCGVGSSRERR